jgi:branched-chain amino acid aminotransferase
MQGCAYVDGQYVAPKDAKISIFDRGFLHSDATYDVAHVWDGKFFRLSDHLERFFASMDRLRLDPGRTRDEVRAVMHECVRRAGLRSAYVEVLCTRGLPQPGSRDPRSCTNKFMAFAIPFVWIADPARQARGIDLIVSDVQRIAAASVDPRVKNYHWLDMVMALFRPTSAAARRRCSSMPPGTSPKGRASTSSRSSTARSSRPRAACSKASRGAR